jgi:hypothetical protein
MRVQQDNPSHGCGCSHAALAVQLDNTPIFQLEEVTIRRASPFSASATHWPLTFIYIFYSFNKKQEHDMMTCA